MSETPEKLELNPEEPPEVIQHRVVSPFPCPNCGELKADSPPAKPHVCDDSTRERYWRKLHDQAHAAIYAEMNHRLRVLGQHQGELRKLSHADLAALAMWIRATQ